MIIECHIVREGSTHVNLERFHYEFRPRPELTGDKEAKVCQVLSTSHQQHFLSLGSDFTEYSVTGHGAVDEKEKDLSVAGSAIVPGQNDAIGQGFVERETELMRREESVKERESELEIKEVELKQREDQISKGEKLLDERELQLNEREQALNDQEKDKTLPEDEHGKDPKDGPLFSDDGKEKVKQEAGGKDDSRGNKGRNS